jgi:hypothetical protein
MRRGRFRRQGRRRLASDREGSADFGAKRIDPSEAARINDDYFRVRFIEEFVGCGSIEKAAKNVGVTPTDVWGWRAADSYFKRRFDGVVICSLEDKSVDTALMGSERLLVFLLKSLKPEVYDSKRLPRLEDLSNEQLQELISRLSEPPKGSG